MRWSEFAEKELIDVSGGERIGSVGQADLLIDPQTGEIYSLLLTVGSSWFGKKQGTREVIWNHIKKIGPEMVIVDSGNKYR
ncbi:YlmC/YmxH family sporulation protein [Melghirimyces algeriensis]|uniref:Sporulation protein, YlmC/YmxH family n=1 Tax=Melghirimyces algeriensis TaxID=910412 RepID=A0A521C445_9BACL|nr:YlmC/YmxH family sporulation protein [Melghirimyces algeriensis]SMO54174.1 sporulation protein, YlmC/YmxH family [Melghirimyces algeriensis]